MKRLNLYTLPEGESMQRRNLRIAMRYFVAVCAVVGSLAMFACGGGGNNNTGTVSSVPVNAATAQSLISAVKGQSITIPDGSLISTSGGIAKNTPLTLAFGAPTSPTAAPFTLTSGNATANGTAAFGSCTFTIVSSTITGLVAGTIPTFDLCNLTISVVTLEFGGNSTTTTVTNLVLGRNGVPILTASFPAGVNITIAIDDTGQLLINDVPTGIIVSADSGTSGNGG